MTSMLSAAIIGIGSDHGDDQAGWMVTDAVQPYCPDNVKCLKIKTPIDLIEWLDGAEQIHLVDAAAQLDQPVRRLYYRCQEDRRLIARLPANSTHGFAVSRALELAESLERRTDHVNLWLVSGCRFRPFTQICASTIAAIEQCARLLTDELRSNIDGP